MGEFISIGDSLIISLFSIVMVFIVLIVISIFISLLKNLDKKNLEPIKTIKDKDIINGKPIKEQASDEKLDEELIVAISAALAASLHVPLPQINIKNIKRINNNSSAWTIAGRQEQLHNKL